MPSAHMFTSAMTADERQLGLAVDREWPPRAVVPLSCGISVDGILEHDAEMRIRADGGRGVLCFELSTGNGFLFDVRLPVAGDPHSLQDAQALARSLRRGTSARVRAHGCLPRTDHGSAVLQLLNVESVVLIQEEG